MVLIHDGIDEISKHKIIAIISALDAGQPISRFVLGEVISILGARNILFKIQVVDVNSVNDAMKTSILKEKVL